MIFDSYPPLSYYSTIPHACQYPVKTFVGSPCAEAVGSSVMRRWQMVRDTVVVDKANMRTGKYL